MQIYISILPTPWYAKSRSTRRSLSPSQAKVFAAALAGDAEAARTLNVPLEMLHQRLFLQVKSSTLLYLYLHVCI